MHSVVAVFTSSKSTVKQNEFQVQFDHCTGVDRFLFCKIHQALHMIESVNANISAASDHQSVKHNKHGSKSRSGKSGHSKKYLGSGGSSA